MHPKSFKISLAQHLHHADSIIAIMYDLLSDKMARCGYSHSSISNNTQAIALADTVNAYYFRFSVLAGHQNFTINLISNLNEIMNGK
jgi:hypothetical protein